MTSSVSAGFSASAGIGWRKHGGFYPINSFNSHFTFKPPSLSASASVDANLTPTVDVLLYGVAGPEIALKTGLALDADISQNPWWSLTAPVDLTASLVIPPLKLSSPTLHVYQHTFDLANAGGPFAGGTPGGGSPGTAATVSLINPGGQTATVGTPASLQIQASDTDGGALTYSATGLPTGLSINSGTGLISGMPTTAGSSNVTVTATDASGPSGNASFNWVINQSGGRGVSAVAAGGHHTCALLAPGALDCWGYNGSGELGNGTTSDSSTPVAVTGISNAVAIAAGADHTCALLATGAVDCWGANSFGQLGDGTTTGPVTCGIACSATPVSVSGITHAVAIAAGGDHTCALLAAGALDCWGYNGYGELGDGTTGGSDVPVPVSGICNAVAIAAGGDSNLGEHTCAALATGAVDCWGSNGFGQLGDSTTSGSDVPVPVTGISNAVAIAASNDIAITSAFGGVHTCALLATGAVDCWGANGAGDLGDGTTTGPDTCGIVACSTTPVPVSGITNAAWIVAGGGDTCALLGPGAVDCWGYNEDGAMGNGTTTISQDVPVSVSGISNAIAIAGGSYHTCALLASGAVDCWGYNGDGELGDGNTTL